MYYEIEMKQIEDGMTFLSIRDISQLIKNQ